MHLECHATLGWVIANLGANDSRRLRGLILLAAVLPDIDAIPYIFGPLYYGLLHHTFGHNIFLGIALALYSWRRFRVWKAPLLIALSFAGHLVTDAWFSNWPLYLFWPLSSKGYLPRGSLELDHPLNTLLVYLVPLVLLLAALLWRRTPLEWIHPKLDALFISFFQRKPYPCATCHQPANLHCENCGKVICPKHASLRKWRLSCPACPSTASFSSTPK